MARPSDYGPGIAGLICDRLAAGETLRAICRDEGMPDKVTVLRWLRLHEEFRTQYARAREEQAEDWADELIEIADTATAEAAQVAKLRVDARKWLMSKAAPKKYGDKVALGGDADAPGIKVEMSNTDLVRRIAFALAGSTIAGKKD